MMQQLLIMIAGPYRGGTTDHQVWAENHRLLNKYALEVLRKGHIPVIGVNVALPIIEVAGMEQFDSIMMPVCLAVAERCDAVLRVGGSSAGADEEVSVFEKKGLPVFYSVDDIPNSSE
jgi:hypothetical protein